MTILGVAATLLLLGSAWWCRSVELNQSYSILEEAMEVENAPAVNSFFNPSSALQPVALEKHRERSPFFSFLSLELD